MYNAEGETKNYNRGGLSNCSKEFPRKLQSSILSCLNQIKPNSVLLNGLEVKNGK